MSEVSIDIKAAPAWDSNKRSEWANFSTDFESYVELCGAEPLVSILTDLANPNSQDYVSTCCPSGQGSKFEKGRVSSTKSGGGGG